MTYTGIILSADGVLCDTSSLKKQAWTTVADSLGIHMSDDVILQLSSASNARGVQILSSQLGVTLSESEKALIVEEKRACYQRLLISNPPILNPGILEMAHWIKEQRFLLGIASTSINALSLIKQLGLSPYVDAVADGNDWPSGAPESYVFYRASRYLSLRPRQCLVVESHDDRIDDLLARGFSCAGLRTKADTPVNYHINSLCDLKQIVAGVIVKAEV